MGLGLKGDLDVYSGLKGKAGNNGIEGLHRAVEVDETLVDAHLKTVEGVGTVTARGLAGGHDKGLGGHAHGALDTSHIRAVLGSTDEVRACLLKSGHVLASEGHADAAHLGASGVRLSHRLGHNSTLSFRKD